MARRFGWLLGGGAIVAVVIATASLWSGISASSSPSPTLVSPVATDLGELETPAEADASGAGPILGTPALTPEPSSTPEPTAVEPSPSPSSSPTSSPSGDLAAAPFRTSPFTIGVLTDAQVPYAGDALLDLRKLPVQTDAHGIPTVTHAGVNGGRPYHQPTGIASFGIRLLDDYRRTSKRAYLDYAKRIGAWLTAEATSSGGALYLPHRFAFALHGDRRETLRAPWYSGMAQGLALSFFSRLHRLTGDPAALLEATGYFLSIRHIGRGAAPWVSYVDASRHLWIEEYPGLTVPDHTLNGFMFATFGLFDFDRETGDPAARQTLLGALTTLRAKAQSYRVPGGVSLYCLAHRVQSLKYHHIHTWQLSAISRMSGDPWFAALSKAFAADHG